MTPNIDDIRRDDELLDALGSRTSSHRDDALTSALGTWVRDVDAPDRALPGGRYARARRGSARVGIVAAITLGTLSVSGVAAAVSGVPGISRVAHTIGFQHRSADFGTGAAAGPVSTRAATPSTGGMASTSDQRDRTDSTRNATGVVGPARTTQATHDHTRRALPGVIIRRSAPEQHGKPGLPGATGSSTPHSTSSSRQSTSSSSSSDPTPSTSRSKTHRPYPTRSPRPTRPVLPTRIPAPTTPSHTRWPTSTPSWGTAASGSSKSSNSIGASGFSSNRTNESSSGSTAPQQVRKLVRQSHRAAYRLLKSTSQQHNSHHATGRSHNTVSGTATAQQQKTSQATSDAHLTR